MTPKSMIQSPSTHERKYFLITKIHAQFLNNLPAMGRGVPAYGNVSVDRILLSYAFFAAGVAATLSIIIAMCGLITGRKEEPTSNKDIPDKTESDDVAGENPTTTTTGQTSQSEGDTAANSKELPFPPGSKLRASQSSVLRSNSEKPTLTTKNFRVTMSMRKAKASMTDINIQKKEKNMTRDDSIWMKPIILGEKCRVPGNVVGESDDRAMINVDGTVASTKFRNHSRQFTMSRDNVFVEKDGVPTPCS